MDIKSVLGLLQHKKDFFNGHPELYRYCIDNFGTRQEVGTVIEIKMTSTDGQVKSTSMTVTDSDLPFLDNVSRVLNEKGAKSV